MLGVVEAMPLPLGAVAAAGAAVLVLAALAVAPDTRTSTNSSDPAVLTSGQDTDSALPGAVSALAARSGGRMIVLRLDPQFWGDVTGFLVQAERTGVRACVANPVYTFIVTSQFICTPVGYRRRPGLLDPPRCPARQHGPRPAPAGRGDRRVSWRQFRALVCQGADEAEDDHALGTTGSTGLCPALRPGRWTAAVWLLGVIAAFACYLQLARTRAVNSDGAGQALQAWDMLHGNLLLHGWLLGDVSYYTTEVPQYVLVEVLRGLN